MSTDIFERALTLRNTGDVAGAETCYRAVLTGNPDHFEALRDLAVIRIGASAFDEAARLLRKAVDSNPNAAEAHNLLGMTYRRLGRNEEAAAQFEQAVALNPSSAEAHFNLGNAHIVRARYKAALTAFEATVRLDPSHIYAHINIAAVFARLERFKEAIPYYERALELKPDRLETHRDLGKILAIIGQDAAALRHFDKIIAAEPGRAEIHAYKSWSLRALGRFDEARVSILNAIELSPNPADLYLALADLVQFSVGDPYLVRMEELLRASKAHSPRGRVQLLFARAKAYRDLGELARSFHDLLEANAEMRRQIDYDEANTLRQLAEMREAFSGDVIRRHQGQGNPSPKSIFIVGMPRSGTTLVEQILASHPSVFGAGELREFPIAVQRLTGLDDAVEGCLARMPDWRGDDLRALGMAYLAAIAPLDPSAERIIDKMPANFQFVGLIHLALPGARIIHLRRNPIDTCLSCFSTLFGGNLPFTYDLAELGRYHRAYQSLMNHWHEVLPKGVMLDVAYEDVVEDLEGQTRRMLAHCGLAWDDACLAFHKTQRSVPTASAMQVRQPIYRSSVGRWLAYKDMLQPLLVALEREPTSQDCRSATIRRQREGHSF